MEVQPHVDPIEGVWSQFQSERSLVKHTTSLSLQLTVAVPKKTLWNFLGKTLGTVCCLSVVASCSVILDRPAQLGTMLLTQERSQKAPSLEALPLFVHSQGRVACWREGIKMEHSAGAHILCSSRAKHVLETFVVAQPTMQHLTTSETQDLGSAIPSSWAGTYSSAKQTQTCWNSVHTLDSDLQAWLQKCGIPTRAPVSRCSGDQ